jgi:hypothetical protein
VRDLFIDDGILFIDDGVNRWLWVEIGNTTKTTRWPIY